MKDGYTIQREKFADIMHELPWLFARQYGELVLDKDGLEENPDYERYVGLENLGVLHCLTVRKNMGVDNVLVGYFFNMVVYHLHHKGLKTSTSELLYVLPGHRRGTGVGLALINEGIRHLQELGVKKMYVITKNNTRLAKLVRKIGFCPIEEVHSLWIGE